MSTKIVGNSIPFTLAGISLIMLIFLVIERAKKPVLTDLQEFYPQKAYFSDKSNGGKSLIEEISDSQYRYVLHEGYEYPYAVASLIPGPTASFNLSQYNSCAIAIQATTSNMLRVTFRVYDSALSKNRDNIHGHIFLEHELPVTNSASTQIIHFDSLRIPFWWYESHEITKGELAKPDFSQVVAIDIGTTSRIPTGVEDIVTFGEITFTAPPKRAVWPLWGFLLFSTLFLLTLLLFTLSPTKKKNNKPLGTLSTECQAITTCIQEHLCSAELSVEKIHQETHIPHLEIPKIVHHHHKLTVPQYINQLRLEKAQQLLRESNLKIVEVAELSGYSNVYHFNRTFKKDLQCSPTTYRKEAQAK